MHPWFIFTTTGGLFTTEADNISKAVAAFRKLKHPNVGEIVGVLRGATGPVYPGNARPTPIFGVVCCIGGKPDTLEKRSEN